MRGQPKTAQMPMRLGLDDDNLGRPLLPLQLEPAVLERGVEPDDIGCGGRDQDLAGAGGSDEAGGGVHNIAEHGDPTCDPSPTVPNHMRPV
jgi:hypothetical protein